MRLLLLNSTFIALFVAAVYASPVRQTNDVTALHDHKSKSLIRRQTDIVDLAYEGCMTDALMQQISTYATNPQEAPQSEEEDARAFRDFDQLCYHRCVERFGREPSPDQRWQFERWGRSVDVRLEAADRPPRSAIWNRGGDQQQQQQQQQPGGGDNSNPSQNNFQSVVMPKWDAFKGRVKGGLDRFSSVLGRVTSTHHHAVGRPGSMPMPVPVPAAKPMPKGFVPIY